MAAMISQAIPGRSAAVEADRLDAVIMARIGAGSGGAAEAAIGRDLAPLVAHRLSPGEWRSRLAGDLERLQAAGLVETAKDRKRLTEAGETRLAAMLPKGVGVLLSWERVRDRHLVGAALGLGEVSARRLKQLGTAAGLQAMVLESIYGLQIDGVPTPARLRAALAVTALERAFGNKLKSGLGSGAGLSAKAGRLLAGQLAVRPRDFGTDTRLVAALAADAVGSLQTADKAIRAALLRRWLAPATDAHAPTASRADAPATRGNGTAPAVPAAKTPARAVAELAVVARSKPDQRPDLDRFAQEVKAVARLRAQGWAGARKAFISHVFQSLNERHPEWRLSDIEFKGMLAEAHRAGRIVLANADLRDKSVAKELQESALPYKNTVWHQVRIDD